MNDSENDSSEYQGWKEEIRSEIEANEGHATPDPHELWDRAAYDARSAADWIDDMPVSEAEIRTAKGDVLSALVALEMAEERLEGSDV